MPTRATQSNHSLTVEIVHLDHINGSAPSPGAVEAVRAWTAFWANPASLHARGREAAAAVQRARGEVAALIGARPAEIFFVSSGTEANVWALEGLAEANAGRGRHLVVSAVEHLSLLQTADRLEKRGWSVARVPVDRHGAVSPEAVERALTPETVLVSVQWANGEVGTLQPVQELAGLLRARGVLFHSDAVAAAGRVPVDVRAVPVDALSLAAHPLGGPPGIGALYVRKGVRILPLFHGGAQEEGRRAGTENLLGIVGMGAAAAEARREGAAFAERIAPLRDRLVRGILKVLPQAAFHGHPTARLPGHVSVGFPGWDGEALVLALDMKGVAVGLGSACSARTMKASHVLTAMGVEREPALGTITCTLGPRTSDAEIRRFLEALPEAAAACESKERVSSI